MITKLVKVGMVIAPVMAVMLNIQAAPVSEQPILNSQGFEVEQLTLSDTQLVLDKPLFSSISPQLERAALTQQEVVAGFVKALVELGTAQVDVLEAFSDLGEADELMTAVEVLELMDSPTKHRLEVFIELSLAANEYIQQSLDAQRDITNIGKQLFSEGLVHYEIGIQEVIIAVNEAERYLQTTQAITAKAFSSTQKDPLITLLLGLSSGGAPATIFTRKTKTVGFLSEALPKLVQLHAETVPFIQAYTSQNDPVLAG